MWNTGTIDQRTRLQLLLFPEGATYDPKSGMLEAVSTCEFFDPQISKRRETNSTNQKKLLPLSNFTPSEALCGSVTLKQKWTYSYVIMKLEKGDITQEFYKSIVEFMEDFCLLVVSAYLNRNKCNSNMDIT
ncbi:hypothetical protein D3C86_1674890 [compost metagenome]